MTKQSLTTGQMAVFCGVNHRTVLRWIKAGYLHAYQLPGGRGDNRVPVQECVEFMREHDIPVPPDLAKASEPNRILVVEDDKAMAAYMVQLLKKSDNITVEVANDGFQAGAMMGTFQPKLLILDLGIPGLNGHEVLRFVRADKRFADLRILIVSGMPRRELEKALDSGADDALAKPFTNEEFVKRVSALL